MPAINHIRHLFVYGTLAPGRPNAHVLASVPGSWQPGTVRGTLYEEGWGAAQGYPGIVLNSEGGKVSGQLFSSPALPDHWQRLDEFEGSGYRRVLATVVLDSGESVQACIYALAQAP